MAYPAARRSDHVDVLHGVEVPDPYRWLEDPDDPETKEWSVAQDDLWGSHLTRLTTRDHFATRIEALTPGMVSAPAVRGGREFFRRREVGQDHDVLFVREGGAERVLVDPNALSEEGLITLDAVSVSKEGDRIAYQLSEGGDEESVLRVLDVTSGEVVDGPIRRCRYSPVAWLPGGSEFFYMRYLTDDEVPDGRGDLHRRVFRHRVGSPIDDDELIAGADSARGTYWSVQVAESGRWLVVSASVGTAPRDDVWIADLEGAGELVPVQVGVDALTGAWVGEDDRLWLHTNRDAPRYRLAVTDPTTPDERHWVDVLTEDADAVLDDVVLAGDAIVALRKRDVAAEVTVHERDGAVRHRIELPARGTAGINTSPGRDDVYVTYADFTRPTLVLHHDPGSNTTSEWARSPGSEATDLDVDVEIRQVFVTSADGTHVPAFVIGTDLDDGPRPTTLYGYGGFNVSLEPEFSSGIAAWVEAGGTYVVANLRGGGEYGEKWHRAGMRSAKQHVFEDFEAVAEWLITERFTTVEQLGISGGSNGGLLVGAALTRRPDLYSAVVCSAPLLDMIRYEHFGLGETWNDEYGRADHPTEFEWLHAYSPYHHVHQGTEYPAVLFTLFDSDTRVDPMHGRKLCAALQWATSSDPDERPVLLRRESDVGHGARSISRTVGLAADRLAFLARFTGLSVG